MRPVKFAALLCIATLSFSCKKDEDTTNKLTDTTIVAPEKSTDGAALFTPQPATRQEYLVAEKMFHIALDITKIPKTGGKIKLPLKENRTAVVFKDSLPGENETAAVAYRYLGRIKNPGFYIVEGSFWEWNEIYLVNQYTGKKDTLWTMPVFSPDKKMMVNLSPGYGMEGNPNGYQLWQVSNTAGNAQLKKIKEADQQEWVPTRVFWEDNRTLIFKAVTVERFMKNSDALKEADFYYFRMKVSQ